MIFADGRMLQVPDDTSDEEINDLLERNPAPMQAAGAKALAPRFLTTIPAVNAGGTSPSNRVNARFLTTMDTPAPGAATAPDQTDNTGATESLFSRGLDWLNNNVGQPLRNSLGIPMGLSLNPTVAKLHGALFYASQQDPNQYARLLHLQDLTGIPPIVSAGNETQIQQWVDANSIDPEAFTITSPRTAGFFSDPISAAVAGVNEIQRQAAIERNAAVMRLSTDGFSAYTPSFWDKAAFNMRQATKFVTGKTTDDLVQSLYEAPITRLAISTVGGTLGQVGDLGSMFGWHGDGPSKENLFQRIETDLKPETVFAGDPVRQYAYYAHTNGLDVLAPIVAGLATGLGEEELVALGLSKLGLSANAIKVASRLAVALTFSAESGGRAYTQTAGAGGSDDDARTAADRTFAINLPANLVAGFADKIPGLNRTPVLTSALAGGLMGGSAQFANNLIAGMPWDTDLLSQAGLGAAMQAGLHVGFGMRPGEAPGIVTKPGIPAEFAAEFEASSFLSSLADTVETAKASKLKERAPETFYKSNQANFQGDPNFRISQEPATSQSIGQGIDPAEVAQTSGSESPVDAARPGREIEVPPPAFLSAEHGQQTAALPDVIAPAIDLSARELRDGRVELQQWVADGGLEKLQSALTQTDPETAATLEWQAIQEDLHQQYVDAGQTPEGADVLATRDANVYGNLARIRGMQPGEMLNVYGKSRGWDAAGSRYPYDFETAEGIAEEHNRANTQARVITEDKKGFATIALNPDAYAFLRKQSPKDLGRSHWSGIRIHPDSVAGLVNHIENVAAGLSEGEKAPLIALAQAIRESRTPFGGAILIRDGMNTWQEGMARGEETGHSLQDVYPVPAKDWLDKYPEAAEKAKQALRGQYEEDELPDEISAKLFAGDRMGLTVEEAEPLIKAYLGAIYKHHKIEGLSQFLRFEGNRGRFYGEQPRD